MHATFISLTIICLTVILYLWVGYRSQVTKPDISRFFLYGHKLPTVGFFSTVSSSSISLGGAILAFLSLGYYSPWVAVIATVSWLLGFLFHYRFMRMVFSSHSEVRERTFTLHSYLGHVYHSELLTVLASIASIIGFAGACGVEMVAVTKLTALYVQTPALELVILIALSLVMGLYSTRGGFVAVVNAAKYQLVIFVAGMILSLVFVFGYIRNPTDLISAISDNLRLTPSSFPMPLLMGVLFLNLPWQLIDMSQWQRTLSCSSINVVARGLVYSCVGIGISWLLLILLGLTMHAVPLLQDPVKTFINLFSGHPIWYAFFFSAALAALFSTADAYVMAASQTYICDLKHPELMSKNGSDDIYNEKQILSESRSIIWILSTVPPLIAYGAQLIVPSLLDLFFMVFTAQLSLVPSLLFTQYLRDIASTAAAMSSIALGLLASVSLFVINLLRPTENLIYYSPMITLTISFACYFLVYLIGTKKKVVVKDIEE